VRIVKNYRVPTGNILVVDGDRGPLEMLSLGDYGKHVNVKCDALGLTKNIDCVKHTKMLPLCEKWVITISTQYGCSCKCNFCDVPLVKSAGNATLRDLTRQVLTGIKLHPEIKNTARLNIHYARMGEPTFNPAVLDATKWLKEHIDPEYKIHPVVSTIMPRKNEWLKTFIHTWMRMKNRLLNGEAGLQLSINSTAEGERKKMFGGHAHTLDGIARIMEGIIPSGRKITLNFAVAGYTVDPSALLKYFDPDDYIIKLTPMHKTHRAVAAGIKTDGEYTTGAPYLSLESKLKDAGYDVLVFVASEYEDRGRITCGNALLSGSVPECQHEVLTAGDPCQ
jgi:23S rRNA (adenine2503-C2)-methyltransferase